MANANSYEARSPSENAQHILTAAQEERFVIEDFRPLVESLEWDLGQIYLRQRGSKAFTNDIRPVPFVINNDGVLSANAAEVLFASVAEAERTGSLEAKILVLEIGIGVGLFARFFLDHFKGLCAKEGKDYYSRLFYIAADRSEQMLADACRNGIFAKHPGRYMIRVVDALAPRDYLQNDPLLPQTPPFLRAVFLNYLLDCLPAADLKFSDSQTTQLYVRTCLARNVRLAHYTGLTPQDLVRRAASNNAAERNSLLDLYGLFASEYDYRPVDLTALPHGDFARQFADNQKTRHILHNYAAIQCLEKLLDVVQPNGFILVNDYGQTEVKHSEDFEHQRFSHATFVGINFLLLKAYFCDGGKCQWFQPTEDSGRIHSRLLGKELPVAVSTLFSDCFSKAAHEKLLDPWNTARTNLQVGRFEAAVAAYHKAVERQPYNWILLHELSLFLTFTLRNPRAGIAMAKAALALNPRCSSDLWNTLGDAYYELGRLTEAKHAYEQALRINAADVRGCYNLSWILLRQGNYRAALESIGKGLATDESGAYYERLLKKQTEILSILSSRNQQRELLLANRISMRAGESPAPQPTVSGQLPGKE